MAATLSPARSPTRSPRAAAKPAAKKAAAKAAAKGTARKPAVNKPANALVTEAPEAAAPGKADKQKLVRDSFTIPAAEYEQIAALKQRGIALGRPVKKSELLRAGLKALAAMADKGLLAALNDVPAIKTGRPKARKKDKAEKAGGAAAR